MIVVGWVIGEAEKTYIFLPRRILLHPQSRATKHCISFFELFAQRRGSIGTGFLYDASDVAAWCQRPGVYEETGCCHECVPVGFVVLVFFWLNTGNGK